MKSSNILHFGTTGKSVAASTDHTSKGNEMKKNTDISQRPADGKFAVWKKIPDPDGQINVTIIDEDNSTYVPKIWAIMEVFDYENDAKNYEKGLG